MAPQIIYNKRQLFIPVGFEAQTVSIDLNGTDELLRNNSVNAIGFGDVFSFVTWIKFTSDPDANDFIFFMLPSAGSNNRMEFTSQLATDEPQFVFWDSSGTVVKNYRFPDSAFSNNVWIMAAFTYDGTTLKGYFDGVEDANPTKTSDNAGNRSANPALTVTIGATSTEVAHAPIRTLYTALYDVELSQAEITAIFNGGTGGSFDLANDSGNYVSSADLQHWWRTGQDSSDIGKDSGKASVLIDIDTDSVNVDATDIVADAP